MTRLRRRVLAFTSATVLGSFAFSPAQGAAGAGDQSPADQDPVLQALERPVPVPAAREPEQVPSVQQPLTLRPGSVSDERYAAEKAPAETVQAPMGAVAVRVPPRRDSGAQAPTVVTNFLGLNRQT